MIDKFTGVMAKSRRQYNAEPFSRAAVLDSNGIASLEKALSQAGVRLLPYPFSHILSIVSDYDFSTQSSAVRAIQKLCFEANLDFADSFSLAEFTSTDSGTNFLQSDLDNGSPGTLAGEDGLDVPVKSYPLGLRQRRISVSLDEFGKLFKLGFFDHFHGLLPLGKIGGLQADGALFRWSSDDTLVLDGLRARLDMCHSLLPPSSLRDAIWGGVFRRVLLQCQLEHGKQAPSTCEVRLTDGTQCRLNLACQSKLDHRRHLLEFRLCDRRSNDGVRTNQLDAICVKFSDAGASKRIHPLNCTILPLSRDDIADANQQLCKALENYPSLFVDHSATGFLNSTSARSVENIRRQINTKIRSTGMSLCLGDADDAMHMPGLLLDSPTSVLYASDLLHDAGLHFINPSGTSGQPLDQLHPLEVLSRSFGRDGRPVYVVRRIMPAASPKYLDDTLPDRIKRKSRVTTFAARMETAIDALEANACVAIPFYTHLGADQCAGATDELYPSSLMQRLQDKVHNFSNEVPNSQRLYVLRASAFYRYLHMLNVVAPQIDRKKGGRIIVRRTKDPHLRTKAPSHAAELHGLTFRVEDASAATVCLERTALPDLLRIGRAIGCDEEWITVLSGGIRQPVSLPVQRREVTVPNLLGNIYYIGIEKVDCDTLNDPFGIRISGENGMNLAIASPSLCRDDESGCIRVHNWAAFPDSTAWFSIFTSRWPTDANNKAKMQGFGSSIRIQLLGHYARSPRRDAYLKVFLMKPSSMFEYTIDPCKYNTFSLWWRMMAKDELGLSVRLDS